jgi:hypothetical protein
MADVVGCSPVTELPKLAAPAKRALVSVGVNHLEDLARFTRDEILALHGMGPNAMKTLDNAVMEATIEYKRTTL